MARAYFIKMIFCFQNDITNLNQLLKVKVNRNHAVQFKKAVGFRNEIL